MAENEEKKMVNVRLSNGRGRPRKLREETLANAEEAIAEAERRRIERAKKHERGFSAKERSRHEEVDQLIPLSDNPDKSGWRERQKMKPYSATDRAGTITVQEDMDFLSQQLSACLTAYLQPMPKSDEELQERILYFYNWCQEQAHLPTFEELALYCGFTSVQYNNIIKGKRKGFSEETPQILARGKEVLKAVDAALAEKSKINAVAYIFRAKNFYEMTDRTETVLAMEEKEEPLQIEDIKARYGYDDDSEVIDGEFTEIDLPEEK